MFHNFATRRYQIIVEVPAWRARSFSEAAEDRVGIRTAHRRCGDHRKGHVVLVITDLGSIPFVVVLLKKIVAGKSQYDQTVACIGLVKFL